MDIQAIRERVGQILDWSGEGGDVKHADDWAEQKSRMSSMFEEDIPNLCDEIERLREEFSEAHIAVLNSNAEIGRLKFYSRNLKRTLESVQSVINESYGVAGWHQNGEIATWGELGLEDEIAEALEREASTK